MICVTRSRIVAAGGRSTTVRPLCSTRNARDGSGSAYDETIVTMERNSASADLRNLRRAGTFSNSSRTLIVVPRSRAAGRDVRVPVSGSHSISMAASAEPSHVVNVNRETLAIDGSASPRNPSVRTCARSSKPAIFEVAWRSSASSASSWLMPEPLSRTSISFLPPFSRRTSMTVAPASMAFSTSSFTTEAGRSTTSPAAIWLIRSEGRRWMRGMWGLSAKRVRAQGVAVARA